MHEPPRDRDPLLLPAGQSFGGKDRIIRWSKPILSE